MAVGAAFTTGLCGALGIIFKITATDLTTFSASFSSALRVTGEITFTTSLLCHSEFLIVD
jgi:hypothetical protein